MANYDKITGMRATIEHIHWLYDCWTRLRGEFGTMHFPAKQTPFTGGQLSRLVAAGILEIVRYEQGEYERYSDYYGAKVRLPYEYAIYALKPFACIFDTIENNYSKHYSFLE